ncbi:hypothetical protein HRD49_07705 [Corallococcus exiguus]|uniref:hypothetical protein n=1 Tax=Corallococcus TaxID=83461 RepID=UPI0011C40BAA|nr:MULTISPECIES: hypothetical protein [Corallococcus]NNC16362.1 hypothetical protein [Corallococcus exiguus]NRD53859.1 hypothetical protein [Corallococcus exiguus]NRD61636.1 hypothetical protein [Corallococcus exiguus]
MKLEGNGWSGDFGGSCPMQGDGEVDGLPFYFRARWDSWELDIAQPGCDPLDVDEAAMARGEGWRHEEIWPGGPYDAGYMELDDVQRCMDRAVALFRASRPATS